MAHYNEQQTWAFMCQRPDSELEFRLDGERMRRKIKGGEQIAKRVHPFFVNEELIGALVDIRGQLRIAVEVRVREQVSGIILHKPGLKPPLRVSAELSKPVMTVSSSSCQTCLPLREVGTSMFV